MLLSLKESPGLNYVKESRRNKQGSLTPCFSPPLLIQFKVFDSQHKINVKVQLHKLKEGNYKFSILKALKLLANIWCCYLSMRFKSTTTENNSWRPSRGIPEISRFQNQPYSHQFKLPNHSMPYSQLLLQSLKIIS